MDEKELSERQETKGVKEKENMFSEDEEGGKRQVQT